MSGAFLSYSHLDNRTPPDAPGAKGWIDFFIEQLRYELDVLGLPEALLWRDANKIAEAERFAPKIDAGLREARLLLAVLSRNYVKRPYCLHELKSFAELKGDEAILRIGKHLVGEDDIPGPLTEREGYNFS